MRNLTGRATGRATGRVLGGLAVALAVMTFGTGAFAETVQLGGEIDDVQEVSCASPSTSRGTVSATLDDVTGDFSWNIVFGNNSPDFDNGALDQGGELAAHFHGPALPGDPAGIQVNVGTGNPKVGSDTLDAGQIADVKAGLWYINIHSTGCAGGEIRGQLEIASATPMLPAWAWGTLIVLLVGLGTVSLARRGVRA